MIVLKKDFKHNKVSLKISSLDDLWYLQQIISSGDIVTGKTERKIKIGDSSESSKVVRKTMTLSVRVEKVEYALDTDILRINGIIEEGTKDVPSGYYHTISVSIGDTFTLVKPSWSYVLRNRLDEAINNSSQSVLFLLFDRDTAIFSLVRQTGIRHLSYHKTGFAGKHYANTNSQDSGFQDIYALLEENVALHKPSSVVVGCPDFWKKNMQKIVATRSLKPKPVFITVSAVDRSSISKLLSRPELETLLENQRLRKERVFTEQVLSNLDKGFVAYGMDDVSSAVQIGAVRQLGVTDSLIQKSRREGWYERLDDILGQVSVSQGTITILRGDEAVRTIDGLTGVVGILRWKID